jgi:hypothetical protein
MLIWTYLCPHGTEPHDDVRSDTLGCLLAVGRCVPTTPRGLSRTVTAFLQAPPSFFHPRFIGMTLVMSDAPPMMVAATRSVASRLASRNACI